MLRIKPYLLPALAALLLLGALLPQLIPFTSNPSISHEDESIARDILEDPSVREMFQIPWVLKVTLERVEISATHEKQHKVSYFNGHTWFGVLWNRGLVRYFNGRATGGEIYSVW